MTEEERLEAIQQLLERLEELSRTHVLLVEGKKDREALDALGIGGDIFQVQSGGGPVAAADYVSQAFDSDLLCEKVLERKRVLLRLDSQPEALPDESD